MVTPWTACLDFETDGIDPNTAHPCSFAVVRVARGAAPELVARDFVNPGRPIPARATEIHKITDDMVANAQPWPDAVRQVLAALDGCSAIACHNAPYDVTILALAANAIGAPIPNVPVLCTLTWARAAWWGQRDRTVNFKLATVAERLGVSLDAHDAGSDALAVGHLLAPLRALCVERSHAPRLVADLGDWTAREGERHERVLADWFRRPPENRWSTMRDLLNSGLTGGPMSNPSPSRPLPAAPCDPDSRTVSPLGDGESGLALVVLPLVLLVLVAAGSALVPIALNALLGAW